MEEGCGFNNYKDKIEKLSKGGKRNTEALRLNFCQSKKQIEIILLINKLFVVFI